MTSTHQHTCTLCEATCGITVTVDGDRVTDIRGDEHDPLSRGYICPKATALADVHHDPDRLRRPLVKQGDGWREAGWDEAFDLVARRLNAIRRAHGKDAVATVVGNAGAHNLGILLYGIPFLRALGSRNTYSSHSLDGLPHLFAAKHLFGHQLLIPVPDLDRTDLLICLGANPAVSNGSFLTAPNIKARLKGIRQRGGRVVLIDPRRTESAAHASEHLFIRPGTDAVLLLAMVRVLFAEGLVRPGRLASRLDGMAELRAAANDYPPEVAAEATGIPAERIRELARELARTPRAAVYGRVGVTTQEFGGLAAWLLVVLNVLTGHLDEPGGSMFGTPAADIIGLAKPGSFGTFRSRVRGLPEFGGELPMAALAEEIDTPGEGRVRALLTVGGNPVLSAPNGARLDAALPGLDFMVAIDFYLNETSRHADVILPPTAQLERSHYELALAAMSVRNVARYVPPVFRRGHDQRHDWEICLELASRILGGGRLLRLLGRGGPEAMLAPALRAGPYGLRKGRRGISLGMLRRRPHGVDLGPLRRMLPGRLAGKGTRIDLAPHPYLADLPRLREGLAAPRGEDELILIGRRQLRSNNSWMHNSPRLVKGKPRCTLLVHPEDARGRGLAEGDLATLSSTVGEITVPVELTDSIMPGVVSLPHGWGHGRKGTRLRVAAEHAGVSMNDITDDTRVDRLTGTAAFSGLRVRLRAGTGG
ncbi:molybdopterin oxidoreductase family protein [Amycolatopsis cihanbeyliensis]|uniref:Anaerobic selenocysteine-containing dehydrogenase n=1 Tax=Amycolatopsis cihanbeyliensis TaxID=1128664 RepID=A0A542DLQ2_AMYCI|nr:molybdopterin oxidoreductase family protein [Amycolatopsis cihanbeyliensis]TQJ04017.1 anaerobic selenocysteine-containing dehydrogenase [Amycolatopsis cihanbeyliensis]